MASGMDEQISDVFEGRHGELECRYELIMKLVEMDKAKTATQSCYAASSIGQQLPS